METPSLLHTEPPRILEFYLQDNHIALNIRIPSLSIHRVLFSLSTRLDGPLKPSPEISQQYRQRRHDSHELSRAFNGISGPDYDRRA